VGHIPSCVCNQNRKYGLCPCIIHLHPYQRLPSRGVPGPPCKPLSPVIELAIVRWQGAHTQTHRLQITCRGEWGINDVPPRGTQQPSAAGAIDWRESKYVPDDKPKRVQIKLIISTSL
jgi:hypothetical protein